MMPAAAAAHLVANSEVAKDRREPRLKSSDGLSSGEVSLASANANAAKAAEAEGAGSRMPPPLVWMCTACKLVHPALLPLCDNCRTERAVGSKRPRAVGQEDETTGLLALQTSPAVRMQMDGLPPAPSPEPLLDRIKALVARLSASEIESKSGGTCSSKAETSQGNSASGETSSLATEHTNGSTPTNSTAPPLRRTVSTSTSGEWQCMLCTLVNSASAVSCAACSVAASMPPITNGHRQLSRRRRGVEGPASSTASVSPSRNHLTLFKPAVLNGEDSQPADVIASFVIDNCRSNRSKFVDVDFPPAIKSLYFKPRSSDHPLVASWQRPGCLADRHEDSPAPFSLFGRRPRRGDSGWVVFRSTPDAGDIVQGRLGDCWMLSALSVLCQKPELLEHIVITKQICKEGVYQVRLCKDGVWKVITVDDNLPCDAYKNLVFSSSRRHQLWVPLIEKAMAKVFGCYEALSEGHMSEGLSMLTGKPVEEVHLKLQTNADGPDPDENNTSSASFHEDLTWAKLLSFKAAGFLMGAGTRNADEDESPYTAEEYESVGLLDRHVYSIVDLRDIASYRLVRLRNPWGRVSWEGAWSDSSPLWTRDLRDELLPYGEDAGIFWMSYGDFQRYFSSVAVCKIRPGWTEERVCGEFRPHGTGASQVAFLTVTEKTQVEISLHQRSGRSCKQDGSLQSDLLLLVVSCDSEGRNLRDCTAHSQLFRQKRDFVRCEAMLEPGHYVVLPVSFLHWIWHRQRNESSALAQGVPPVAEEEDRRGLSYCITVHSSRALNVCSKPPDSYILADAMWIVAKRLGTRNVVCGGTVFTTLSRVNGGGVLKVFENTTEWPIQVEVDASDSRLLSTRSSLLTADIVPPFFRQVVAVLTNYAETPSFYTPRLQARQVWGAQPVLNGARAGKVEPSLLGLHAARPIG